MKAYYNENDPYAAQWLRNLIQKGLITPGYVDERSIEDVRPDELAGYDRCHFFAGIGIWDAALNDAGWTGPVWTGSCPCQPFSSAGKGEGVADERHLWPAWLHLIKHGKPAGVPVFGEQVASDDGLAWLDIVQGDMEAEGYTVWPLDLCAAGVGAPHIRQRLFFVAHAADGQCDEQQGEIPSANERGSARWSELRTGGHSPTGILAHADGNEQGRRPGEAGRTGEEVRLRAGADLRHGLEAGELGDTAGIGSGPGPRYPRPAELRRGEPADASAACVVEHPQRTGLEGQHWDGNDRDQSRRFAAAANRSATQTGRPSAPGPVNGFWANAEGVWCRHPTEPGRWELRPVEPGTFPLVDGSAFRLGSGGPFEGKSRQALLKGYGNGIVRPLAAAFIRAYMTM